MPALASNSAKELKPGYRLSHFVIERSLGQGEHGITYKALDTSANRMVAIKEYYPSTIAIRQKDFSLSPQVTEYNRRFEWGLNRFLKKAIVFSKVKHASVVQVQKVFKANGTAYVVMDYEEGESLLDLVTVVGTLDQSSQERMLFPVLTGLALIHELGVIHGDIKPSNIKIRRNGSAVLINFGFGLEKAISRSEHVATDAPNSYEPLEQFNSGSEHLGAWTDIYSLAAIMYRGITGSEPEDALSRLERRSRGKDDRVMALALSTRPAYLKGFLDAVVLGMSLDKDLRPQKISAWLPLFSSVSPTRTEHVASNKAVSNKSRTLPGAEKNVGNRRRNTKVFLLAIFIIFLIVWVKESNLFNTRVADPKTNDVKESAN